MLSKLKGKRLIVVLAVSALLLNEIIRLSPHLRPHLTWEGYTLGFTLSSH